MPDRKGSGDGANRQECLVLAPPPAIGHCVTAASSSSALGTGVPRSDTVVPCADLDQRQKSASQAENASSIPVARSKTQFVKSLTA
jgi:hypothetical protein